jgi:hypothetical protein
MGYEGMNVVLEPAKMQRKPRMKAAVEKSSARSAWGRIVAAVSLSCLRGWEREVFSELDGSKHGIQSVMPWTRAAAGP